MWDSEPSPCITFPLRFLVEALQPTWSWTGLLGCLRKWLFVERMICGTNMYNSSHSDNSVAVFKFLQPTLRWLQVFAVFELVYIMPHSPHLFLPSCLCSSYLKFYWSCLIARTEKIIIIIFIFDISFINTLLLITSCSETWTGDNLSNVPCCKFNRSIFQY